MFAVLGAVFVTALGNLGELRVLRLWLEGEVANDWWFWNATRVIAPEEGEPGPITEFPAFTFIYGDLHAHAMALPLAGLALALTVAVVRESGGPRALAPLLGLLGVTLGALWVTNTWDLPTYGLLAACGVGIAALRLERTRRTLLFAVLGIGGLARVAYPHSCRSICTTRRCSRGSSDGRGGRRDCSTTSPSTGSSSSPSCRHSSRNSRLPSTSAVCRGRTAVLSATGIAVAASASSAPPSSRGRAYRVGMWAVPAALVAAAGCAVVGLWPEALAVVIALLAMSCWPVRTTGDVTASERALRRLLVVLVVVGLGLTMFVEFYVARNVDIGRTNTVFKHYLQVWVMWAVAAAVSVGIVYERLPSLPRWIREVWRVAFVLLFVSALLYPVLAARAKIQDRFDTSVGRTLDGTAFMTKAVFSDKAQAIPFPTTATRSVDPGERRRLAGRGRGQHDAHAVRLAGALLVVHRQPDDRRLGLHQRQQRPPQSEEVQARVADVQKAYRTKRPAVAHRILAAYGASYVVVGPLERAYFPEGTRNGRRAKGATGRSRTRNPGVSHLPALASEERLGPIGLIRSDRRASRPTRTRPYPSARTSRATRPGSRCRSSSPTKTYSTP